VNVGSLGALGASVLTNSGVVDELKAVAAEAVFAVTGQVHAGRRQGRAADQSFWGIGVPSLFGSLSHQPPAPVKMLTALGWWWHTPYDRLDKIDPDNLVRTPRSFCECSRASSPRRSSRSTTRLTRRRS
jgi:hypothetical protein